MEVIYDVGANDGYFTYGCAQALKGLGSKLQVIAFEPGLADNTISSLPLPAKWKHYAGIDFEFIPLCVGGVSNERTITLDKVYDERPSLHGKVGLIKVDVEGAEIDVLSGAKRLLKTPHQWAVEVHGDALIAPVRECFTQAGRTVRFHKPEPHWLLGAEVRGECCWCATVE